MFKIFVYYLILNIIITNLNKVESCGSSSKSNCPQYTYKNFKLQKNIISQLPNKRQIGHLALIGTHQSMSYSTNNLDIKTQELSVTDQLKSGVRVLHISVRLENGKFEIYSSGITLNKTLFNILLEIEQFLYFNPRELVILIVDYDEEYVSFHGFYESDLCKQIDNYSRVVAGWRFVKNWTLSDTISNYRGRILLATNHILFRHCMFLLENRCVNSNDVQIENVSYVSHEIGNKWERYLSLSKNCHLHSKYLCFFYDMSIDIYDINIHYLDNYHTKDFVKYGYYNALDNKCHDPLNYKIVHTDRTTCVLALNIYIFDYVTQELIDHFNQMNNLTIYYDFDD